MINDSSRKLFGKIRVIDILAIIIILAAIGGIGLKYSKARSVVAPFIKADEIQTVFFCEEVPEFSASQMEIGDIVEEPDRKVVFGHVKEIRIGKSINYVVSESGEYVVSSKAGYVSVYITVEGKGLYTNGSKIGGVTFDNTDYFIGREFAFRAGKVGMFGRISEVSKKG